MREWCGGAPTAQLVARVCTAPAAASCRAAEHVRRAAPLKACPSGTPGQSCRGALSHSMRPNATRAHAKTISFLGTQPLMTQVPPAPPTCSLDTRPKGSSITATCRGGERALRAAQGAASSLGCSCST